MSVYTYLKSVNSVKKLTEYILLSLPDLQNITYDEGSRNTDIVFSTSLSPEQKVTLDELMDAYTNPEEELNHRLIQISSTELSSDLQTWHTLLSWEETYQIYVLHVFAKLVPSPTDYLYSQEDFKYSIRLVNTSHNIIIGEETDYTNSEYSMLVIPISGLVLQHGNVHLELQVKKYSAGDSIRIFNCNTHY